MAGLELELDGLFPQPLEGWHVALAQTAADILPLDVNTRVYWANADWLFQYFCVEVCRETAFRWVIERGRHRYNETDYPDFEFSVGDRHFKVSAIASPAASTVHCQVVEVPLTGRSGRAQATYHQVTASREVSRSTRFRQIVFTVNAYGAKSLLVAELQIAHLVEFVEAYQQAVEDRFWNRVLRAQPPCTSELYGIVRKVLPENVAKRCFLYGLRGDMSRYIFDLEALNVARQNLRDSQPRADEAKPEVMGTVAEAVVEASTTASLQSIRLNRPVVLGRSRARYDPMLHRHEVGFHASETLAHVPVALTGQQALVVVCPPNVARQVESSQGLSKTLLPIVEREPIPTSSQFERDRYTSSAVRAVERLAAIVRYALEKLNGLP